jgi:very-short-patch-repair endonuclease
MRQKINNIEQLKARRKKLRTGGSLPEALVWNQLKHRQLLGLKFRRQHSISGYIVDFYCPAEKLAIELDGATHDNEKAQKQDFNRDHFLKQLGIRVLRFQNKDVLFNLDGVLKEIEKQLKF